MQPRHWNSGAITRDLVGKLYTVRGLDLDHDTQLYDLIYVLVSSTILA